MPPEEGTAEVQHPSRETGPNKVHFVSGLWPGCLLSLLNRESPVPA